MKNDLDLEWKYIQNGGSTDHSAKQLAGGKFQNTWDVYDSMAWYKNYLLLSEAQASGAIPRSRVEVMGSLAAKWNSASSKIGPALWEYRRATLEQVNAAPQIRQAQDKLLRSATAERDMAAFELAAGVTISHPGIWEEIRSLIGRE